MVEFIWAELPKEVNYMVLDKKVLVNTRYYAEGEEPLIEFGDCFRCTFQESKEE